MIKVISFTLLAADIIYIFAAKFTDNGGFNLIGNVIAIPILLVIFFATAGVSEVVDARSKPKIPMSMEDKKTSKKALVIISLLVTAGLIAYLIIR